MDFRQLESFVEIVKLGSFTRAAEKLFLTQPTLSGHILSLEGELGTVLLNRCGKTVTLTEAGQILYNQALNILNQREQAIFSLARYEGKLEGTLNIAASTVPQSYLLPGLLTALNREFPGITFVLRQYDSRGVADAIMSGAMDFGFVGAMLDNPELQAQELARDRLILIAGPETELCGAEDGSIPWEQVKTEGFILREEGSATRALLASSLDRVGADIRDLKVVANIENPDTIKRCVREGLGVAVVSEKSVAEEIRLGFLRGYRIAGLDLERFLYFISHKSRVLSPVARAFRDFTAGYRVP